MFKSLIIAHLMIREGQSDVTLRHIAESPRRLAISNFTDGAFRSHMSSKRGELGETLLNVLMDPADEKG